MVRHGVKPLARSWSRAHLRGASCTIRAVHHSLVLALPLLVACSSPQTIAPHGAPPKAPASEVERYFPLEEGKLYHYATRDGDETGMLVAKVHRTDALHAELQLSNATKRFAVAPDGVTYVGGPYILKAPLDVGASWRGEHGGTTMITRVDAAVQVPAGDYASCILTVEEGARPPGVRYETTYCPGVGMVRLIVSAPGTEARAELKSYGLPVKIE